MAEGLFRSLRLGGSNIKVPVSKSNDILDRKRAQSITGTFIENIPSISEDQNKLIRGSLVILRSYKENICKIAKEYLQILMMSQEYYSNVLVDNYFDEISKDWSIFYNKFSKEFSKLEKMKILLTKDNLNELDKEYVKSKEYLPLREEIESYFRTECELFYSKYGINIQTNYSQYSHLVWEGRNQNLSKSEIIKLIKTSLFRSLKSEYKDQLAVLSPYSSNFTTGKKKKTLEKVLIGLTDYECFKYQYDFDIYGGGSRSYLSKFSESVEKITKITVEKLGTDDPVIKEKIETKRLLCAHYLWQLFASILSVEKIAKEFCKLQKSDSSLSNAEKGNGLTGTENMEMDPGIYFTYLNIDISKSDNQLSLLTDIDEVNRYLMLMRNYQKCCSEIYELIETIIPILNSVIDFNKTAISSGSSSSRRRKITIPETFSPLNITNIELYGKFLVIKNSYASQSKVLEQLLK